MAKFMFLLCEYGRYQELKYASCVARRIAEEVKKLGHQVILVERPSPEDANKAIEQYKPDVVWWIGHGGTDVTTLEKVRVWIKAPDYNTKILDDTIACALSCLTGVYLGKCVTEKEKCRAYLGYKEKFWFMWCKDPEYYNCACQGRNIYGVREELWKKIVECMHESNLYFVLGLAKGMKAKDAMQYSIKRFDYWIDYFENIEPKDNNEASALRTVLWILKNDRDITVLHGDHNATVSGEQPAKMAVGIPMLLLALGSAVSYVASRGGERVGD